jgi:DNA-binding transcriptional MocR family regulator
MAATSARTIRADIESRIAAGDLRTGDRLASVRDLAVDLGVSPATVAAAYRELRLRGMVAGRGRQGTRVAPARRVEAGFQSNVPVGLVDATHGSPDPNQLPALGPALEFAASFPQPSYGGPLVEPMLVEAARAHFESDGIDCSNLIVTSGAMDAVERVLSAFDLRIGDRIGVEDPGHIPVHQIARSSGLELVPLPVDDHGITPDGLQSALRGGLAAIIVTPRAHNPTGAAFTADRAADLSTLLAKEPATALIQDDHAGLISGVDYHPIAAPGPRWATMRSLGKSFGPDVRVSLVVGDDQTMHRVTVGLSNGPGWVSFILQRVAAYFLADAVTMQLLSDTAASYERRRNLLIDRLADHGVRATGASGLNVWIPTPREHGALDAARQAGYAIRSGSTYQLTAERAVRVTISSLSDQHIHEIADAIGSAHQTQPAAASM